MNCVDLSNDAPKTPADHISKLCAVCQEIDFVSLTDKACNHGDENRHFHIGPLRHVLKKEFCSGCRLIGSAAKFTGPDDDELLDANITIRQVRLWTHIGEASHDLHEQDVVNENAAARYEEAHLMESHLDVVFESQRMSRQGRVTGTIVRAQDAATLSSTGSTGEVSDSGDNFRVHGRSLPPEVNVDMIKDWMQFCHTRHHKCRIPAQDAAREQMIRLIDVQEHKIVQAALAEKYVALSYVWGPTTKPLLTRNTLLQYSSLNGLKDSTIPQTISDAIQLVGDIDERYLWVDSLCIIQDDDGDKQRQLPIMDSIYGCAELVIVAATGSDAHAGLPGVRNTKRYVMQRTEEVTGMKFMTAHPAVQQVLNWTKWNTRGWTFQEAILSRRALVFAGNQIFWNCRVDTWREDVTGESSAAGLPLTEDNSLWGPTLNAGICRTYLYCRQVEKFSERAFKEGRDVLWAFMGILKLQASRFPEGFIWGLPYERLDAALLWSEDGGCFRTHPRHDHHPTTKEDNPYYLPYPSWSWLSTTRNVSFRSSCGDSIISNVTWHEPLRLGDKTQSTYLELIHSKESTDGHEYDESVDLLSKFTLALDVTDYGLLHFTTQTTELIFKWDGERRENEDNADLDQWVKASILSPARKEIGTLTVPLLFLNNKLERTGEFALLSSNARNEPDDVCKLIEGGLDCGCIKHINGCGHIQSRNVMLIEWSGVVAYRKGLGTVDEGDWREIVTVEKRIVLG